MDSTSTKTLILNEFRNAPITSNHGGKSHHLMKTSPQWMYAVVNVQINSKVTIMKQTIYNPYRKHTAMNSIYHYPLIFVNCNVHVLTSADVFTQLSRRRFEFDKIMSSPADLHHILSGTSQERSGPQRLGTCWPVKQHIGIYKSVFTIHVWYIVCTRIIFKTGGGGGRELCPEGKNSPLRN